LHILIKVGSFRTTTARYVIDNVDQSGDTIDIGFTEEPKILTDGFGNASDLGQHQCVVSYSEIVVEPPAEPEEPTKRSDIILGYDAGKKLWTPHKADYLPLDGGRLSSQINFRGGDKKDYDQFTISPNSGENDYATNFFQRNGGEFRIRSTPDKNGNSNYTTHFIISQATSGNPVTKISYLQTPTSPHHAVNKEYVDWKPPGLKYLYQSNLDSVGEGKFSYDSSIKRMRLSTKSLNNVDFSDGLVADISNTNQRWTFTVWHQNSTGKWHVRVTGLLSRIDFHADDLYCYVERQNTKSGFAVDATYWITIAGLF
ncbi:MAG: hypothetical protein ACR2NF_11380, partial [Pirellulales bacterium]